MSETMQILSHLILTINPMKYMLHPNFTDEEAEDSRN